MKFPSKILAAYLDVSSKRSLLNNLLTYLNLQDQITTLKLESPGIDGYDLCNYTLGSIGITIWIGGKETKHVQSIEIIILALIFAIIFNRKERLKLKNTKKISWVFNFSKKYALCLAGSRSATVFNEGARERALIWKLFKEQQWSRTAGQLNRTRRQDQLLWIPLFETY